MVALRQDKTFPVLISNHRNKTFRVKRGSVVGKMEKLKEETVVTSVEETKEEMGKKRQRVTGYMIFQFLNLSEAMSEH